MERMGFVGTGLMGEPMARNLARARAAAGAPPLLVWNRTPDRAAALAADGAVPVAEVDELMAASDLVVVMLADEPAVDAVLGRGSGRFARLVAGRTVVLTSTVAPGYSAALSADVVAAGGRYVEAPVSGSRGPAAAGQLVAMLAGHPDDVARARAALEPTCAQTFACGAVPSALLLKLAVNVFLITQVSGLVEAVHLADRSGLDRSLLRAVLDAGPMASTVSRGKLAQLLDGDLAARAAASDVLKNTELITAAARSRGAASPLLDVCRELFAETVAGGHGGADMVAVLRAVEGRAAEGPAGDLDGGWRVRAATPSDEAAVAGTAARCTPQTLRRRFHAGVRSVPDGYLVAALGGGSVVAEATGGRVVALASLLPTAEPGSAELGVLVEDAWQRRGVGRSLIAALTDRARATGVRLVTLTMCREQPGLVRWAATRPGVRVVSADGCDVALEVSVPPSGPLLG